MRIFGYRLPIRYNKYILALDIFGILSTALTILYLVGPDYLKPADPREDGMLANVLSELIGIWVSVRLIEFFIRKNESRDRLRVRVVRNARMFENISRDIYHFMRGHDAFKLRRELEWVSSVKPARMIHLSRDEVDDFDSFFTAVNDFARLIPDFRTRGDDPSPLVLPERERMKELVEIIHESRVKLERNILEETDEDSGLS